jgi:hypothetical protein
MPFSISWIWSGNWEWWQLVVRSGARNWVGVSRIEMIWPSSLQRDVICYWEPTESPPIWSIFISFSLISSLFYFYPSLWKNLIDFLYTICSDSKLESNITFLVIYLSIYLSIYIWHHINITIEYYSIKTDKIFLQFERFVMFADIFCCRITERSKHPILIPYSFKSTSYHYTFYSLITKRILRNVQSLSIARHLLYIDTERNWSEGSADHCFHY